MVELKVLSIPVKVKVRLKARFTAVCPISGAVDIYNLEVEYAGDGKYVEVGSFREYLDAFKCQSWHYEDLCEKIWKDLVQTLGEGALVRVRLRSSYLGVAVEVEKEGAR